MLSDCRLEKGNVKIYETWGFPSSARLRLHACYLYRRGNCRRFTCHCDTRTCQDIIVDIPVFFTGWWRDHLQQSIKP
ncbi:hypothetical protein EMIT0111MI5_100244 [Burkholderia sp. IT-111MI5]